MAYLWVHVHMGYVALHARNLDEAQDIFLETSRNFHRDGHVIGTIFALEGIAALYAETGQYEQAARLIGLADATREKVGDPRPLLEQVDVDKIIDTCLIRMGEAAFSDAYDRGQEMTLEQAVALVQKESLPSPISRSQRQSDRVRP